MSKSQDKKKKDKKDKKKSEKEFIVDSRPPKRPERTRC